MTVVSKIYTWDIMGVGKNTSLVRDELWLNVEVRTVSYSAGDA